MNNFIDFLAITLIKDRLTAAGDNVKLVGFGVIEQKVAFLLGSAAHALGVAHCCKILAQPLTSLLQLVPEPNSGISGLIQQVGSPA